MAMRATETRRVVVSDHHSASLRGCTQSMQDCQRDVQRAVFDVRAGTSQHLAGAMALARSAKAFGFRLKLNTVVCATNADDNMNAVAMSLMPDRWKVFKVLPVRGQNDGVGHTGVSFV